MIEIISLYKSFGEKKVLDNINIKIPKGSLFGFVGVNGAGKSTLIKCLYGFLKPDQGVIKWEGNEIEDRGFLKDKLGYLPEVFQAPLDLKCGEFLNYCYSLGNNKSLTTKEINLMLDRVGLMGKNANLLIRSMSKGMRQRLGIAQALIRNPMMVILDEPFSGLDPIGRFELKNLFRKLNNEGITIFFSSHNLTEIQDMCSHISILHNGKIKISDKVENILLAESTKDMEKAFISIIGYEKEKKETL